MSKAPLQEGPCPRTPDIRLPARGRWAQPFEQLRAPRTRRAPAPHRRKNRTAPSRGTCWSIQDSASSTFSGLSGCGVSRAQRVFALAIACKSPPRLQLLEYKYRAKCKTTCQRRLVRGRKARACRKHEGETRFLLKSVLALYLVLRFDKFQGKLPGIFSPVSACPRAGSPIR